jgi:hypothetical protein
MSYLAPVSELWGLTIFANRQCEHAYRQLLCNRSRYRMGTYEVINYKRYSSFWPVRWHSVVIANPEIPTAPPTMYLWIR